MTHARGLLTTAAATALVVLTGCGSGGSGSDEQSGPGATASPGGPTSTPSAAASAPTVAPFTFAQDPPEDACYRTRKSREVAWYASPINVTADGSVTAVLATNSPGATLRGRDSLQVPLVGGAEPGEVGGVSDWPLKQKDVDRFVLLGQSEDLVGAPLTAGSQVLPVLHLVVEPDAEVGSFVFRYELANGQEREVTYDVGLRFPQGTC